MRARAVVVALVSLFLASGAAFGQGEHGKHEVEVTLAGFGNALDGSGGGTINQLGYGYFISSAFEMKSRFVFSAGSNMNWGLGLSLNPTVHIPASDRLNPVFGISVGLGLDERGSKSQKSLVLGVSGGLKVFSKGGGGSINMGPHLTYTKGFDYIKFWGDSYGGYDLLTYGFTTGASVYF